MSYLVIQDLKEIAKLSGSTRIEGIGNDTFRLHDYKTQDGVAEYCAKAKLDFAFVPQPRKLSDIETGIDIPTANTILIERADKFGLAQLHQLRGRVGRSHHQAYAYLLTPGEEALSAAAKKRLEAIQMMEELGSGFYLAMHDLEIRGAGEVLGESQSGEMQEVGFNLYADMLDHAVRSLKAGREPDLSQPFEVTTEVNLHFLALLPASYCADVHERLVLYKRFANCDTPERVTSELPERALAVRQVLEALAQAAQK